MTLPSEPSESGVPSSNTRAEEVAKVIAQSDLLQQLAQQHELNIYRFDQAARPTPLAAIEKVDAAALTTEALDADEVALVTGRQFMYLPSALAAPRY